MPTSTIGFILCAIYLRAARKSDEKPLWLSRMKTVGYSGVFSREFLFRLGAFPVVDLLNPWIKAGDDEQRKNDEGKGKAETHCIPTVMSNQVTCACSRHHGENSYAIHAGIIRSAVTFSAPVHHEGEKSHGRHPRNQVVDDDYWKYGRWVDQGTTAKEEVRLPSTK